MKIDLFYNLKEYIDGCFITLLDLYYNLYKYGFNINLIINKSGFKDNNIYFIKFGQQYLGKKYYNVISQIHRQNIYNYDILFITAKDVFDFPVFQKYKCIFVLDTGHYFDEYLQNNNVDKYKRLYDSVNNIYLLNNSFNHLYFKNSFNSIEYYHKLSRDRLDYLKFKNTKKTLSSLENLNADDLYLRIKQYPYNILEDTNIHSYSIYKYARWMKYREKTYFENIGKLIYEYIYLNKNVEYYSINKEMDDGLTSYFNYLGFDDNVINMFDSSHKKIIDNKLFMSRDDIILKLLKNILNK